MTGPKQSRNQPSGILSIAGAIQRWHQQTVQCKDIASHRDLSRKRLSQHILQRLNIQLSAEKGAKSCSATLIEESIGGDTGPVPAVPYQSSADCG